MLLAELGMRVFFYIAKALIFRREQKHPMNVKLRLFLRSFYKPRHTGATLAKQAGVSLEAISEALTHSNKEITKTYVNTKDIVNRTVGDIAFRSLKK